MKEEKERLKKKTCMKRGKNKSKLSVQTGREQFAILCFLVSSLHLGSLSLGSVKSISVGLCLGVIGKRVQKE